MRITRGKCCLDHLPWFLLWKMMARRCRITSLLARSTIAFSSFEYASVWACSEMTSLQNSEMTPFTNWGPLSERRVAVNVYLKWSNKMVHQEYIVNRVISANTSTSWCIILLPPHAFPNFVMIDPLTDHPLSCAGRTLTFDSFYTYQQIPKNVDVQNPGEDVRHQVLSCSKSFRDQLKVTVNEISIFAESVGENENQSTGNQSSLEKDYDSLYSIEKSWQICEIFCLNPSKLISIEFIKWLQVLLTYSCQILKKNYFTLSLNRNYAIKCHWSPIWHSLSTQTSPKAWQQTVLHQLGIGT